MVLSFLGYHVCKAFVEGCCFPSHATSCRENQRGEYATLDFPDSLSVFPLLGLFMSPVNRWGVCWTVGRCVWVEHPYIKKCILCHVPKTSCTDVYMGSIVSVCRVSYHTLPTKRLEWGLGGNIVADFSKKWSCDTPCLQITDVRLRSLGFLLEPQASDWSRSLVPMRVTL